MRAEAVELAVKIAQRRGFNVSRDTVERNLRTVGVRHARPYTVVTLNGNCVGVSKYNPNDAKAGLRWNPHVGTQHALKRAVEYLLRTL